MGHPFFLHSIQSNLSPLPLNGIFPPFFLCLVGTPLGRWELMIVASQISGKMLPDRQSIDESSLTLLKFISPCHRYYAITYEGIDT